MSIGNVIQHRRKELGLTQAQIADKLGVTAPAVNKWEKDISCPDISIMPPLARLLGIDMNELFSFYERLSESEIMEIRNSVSYALLGSVTENKKEAYKKMLAIVDEAVKNNPSDPALHEALAGELSVITFLDRSEKATPLIKKSIELYESALSLEPDRCDELSASLVEQYNKLHEYDKAESAWELISDKKIDKSWMHAEMLYSQERYTDASREMAGLILSQITDLSLHLSLFSNSLLKEGRKKKSKLAEEKRASLINLFDLWEGLNNFHDFSSSMSNGDKSDALTSLLEIFKSTEVPKTFTSCILFDEMILEDEESLAFSINQLIEVLNAKSK